MFRMCPALSFRRGGYRHTNAASACGRMISPCSDTPVETSFRIGASGWDAFLFYDLIADGTSELQFPPRRFLVEPLALSLYPVLRGQNPLFELLILLKSL